MVHIFNAVVFVISILNPFKIWEEFVPFKRVALESQSGLDTLKQAAVSNGSSTIRSPESK